MNQKLCQVPYTVFLTLTLTCISFTIEMAKVISDDIFHEEQRLQIYPPRIGETHRVLDSYSSLVLL